MELQEIKADQESLVDKLITDCGVFFAFSNEQLEEGMKKSPLKPGEKYRRIVGGGFIPAGNYDKFQKGLDEICNQERDQIKKNNLEEQEIAYELANHECYYTRDISQVVEMFKGVYTVEQIRTVYVKNLEHNLQY